MTDRFKFRVWRVKENCYNHQKPFSTCCILENGLLAYFDEETQMQNFIIEQCTGLKDKNGKLIYEGDVVYDSDINELGTIVFDEASASFIIQYDDDFCDFFDGFELEIYGNIHENKDLLEDNNDL